VGIRRASKVVAERYEGLQRSKVDGCIAVHPAAAGKPGATREEIAEALRVGISVNASAVYSARMLDAFDATA
jgi:alkylhydroperoxidase/carboxymuconolactone decarboxylase family protein YurZ